MHHLSVTAKLFIRSKVLTACAEKQVEAELAGNTFEANFWKEEFGKELATINEQVAIQKADENKGLSREDLAEIFDTSIENIP